MLREYSDHGADINSEEGYNGCAIQAATLRYGHSDLVMKFLAKGRSPTPPVTITIQSSKRPREVDIPTQVIQILLEHGTDVYIAGGFCVNELNAAHSLHSHAAMEMLEAHIALSNAGRSPA